MFAAKWGEVTAAAQKIFKVGMELIPLQERINATMKIKNNIAFLTTHPTEEMYWEANGDLIESAAARVTEVYKKEMVDLLVDEINASKAGIPRLETINAAIKRYKEYTDRLMATFRLPLQTNALMDAQSARGIVRTLIDDLNKLLYKGRCALTYDVNAPPNPSDPAPAFPNADLYASLVPHVTRDIKEFAFSSYRWGHYKIHHGRESMVEMVGEILYGHGYDGAFFKLIIIFVFMPKHILTMEMIAFPLTASLAEVNDDDCPLHVKRWGVLRGIVKDAIGYRTMTIYRSRMGTMDDRIVRLCQTFSRLFGTQGWFTRHVPQLEEDAKGAFLTSINMIENIPLHLARLTHRKIIDGSVDAKAILHVMGSHAASGPWPAEAIGEAINMTRERLASRLLMRNHDLHTERGLLHDFFKDIGSASADMRAMIRDATVSRRGAWNGGCEVVTHVEVISAAHWPVSRGAVAAFKNLAIPPAVSSDLVRIEAAYTDENPHRCMEWARHMGTVEIEVRPWWTMAEQIDGNVYELNNAALCAEWKQATLTFALGPLPAWILLKFNGGRDRITVIDIVRELGVDERIAMAAINHLVSGTQRILSCVVKDPSSGGDALMRKVVHTDEVLELNPAYRHTGTSPIVRVGDAIYETSLYPEVSLGSRIEKDTCPDHRAVASNLDTTYAIKATIVRYLKIHKTCKHADLVAFVTKSVVAQRVTVTDIKRDIESLVEREYIERGSSPDVYVYIP